MSAGGRDRWVFGDFTEFMAVAEAARPAVRRTPAEPSSDVELQSDRHLVAERQILRRATRIATGGRQ